MKLCIPALLLACLSYADAPAQTDTLSMARCIEMAMRHSYRVQENEAGRRAAGAAYRRDRALYFPHLFGNVAHDQLFFGPYNYLQQVGQVTADWSTGEWLMHTADIQRTQMTVLEADRRQTALEVTRRIAGLYVGILQARVARQLLRDRIDVLNSHLQVTRALWQAGIRTQFDVMQTQTSISRIEEQVITTDMETRNLRQTLARLIDMPEPHLPVLRDFPEAVIRRDSLFTPAAAAAVARNPQLLSLARRRQVQEMQLRRIKASKLPRVQLRGGFIVDHDPTAEGRHWRTGIDVQMPVFRWGMTAFQEQEIRAVAESLQFRQENLDRELLIKHDRLAANLHSLQTLYRLQENRLQRSREMVQIATVNYQAGLLTNLDFLDAQNTMLENQLALHRTRLTFVATLIDDLLLTDQSEKIAQLQGAH